MLIPFFNYLGLAMSGLFINRQKQNVKKEADTAAASHATAVSSSVARYAGVTAAHV